MFWKCVALKKPFVLLNQGIIYSEFQAAFAVVLSSCLSILQPVQYQNFVVDHSLLWRSWGEQIEIAALSIIKCNLVTLECLIPRGRGEVNCIYWKQSPPDQAITIPPSPHHHHHKLRKLWQRLKFLFWNVYKNMHLYLVYM